MDDEAELTEFLVVGDQAVGTVEGILMRLAVGLKGGLHFGAAEGGRIRVLRSGRHSAVPYDFQLST